MNGRDIERADIAKAVLLQQFDVGARRLELMEQLRAAASRPGSRISGWTKMQARSVGVGAASRGVGQSRNVQHYSAIVTTRVLRDRNANGHLSPVESELPLQGTKRSFAQFWVSVPHGLARESTS